MNQIGMSSHRIIHGATHNLPDLVAFIEILNTLEQSPTPEARHLLSPKANSLSGGPRTF